MIPYHVEYTEELTTYEIEEYTVTNEVPFITEWPKVVEDIQQEVYTVPTVTKTTHAHDVLHDVNFGRDSIVSETVEVHVGEEGY